jgi:hypothetical protein
MVRCPRERHEEGGSAGLAGEVKGSASSRNEQGRGSTGLRKRVRLRRRGMADVVGGGEDSDKRPEVKSREYWWNGISEDEGMVGVEGNMEVEYKYQTA